MSDEIDYQQFSDHFVISYGNLEDKTPPAVNTATLTLFSDGTVTMYYGSQQSNYSFGSGLLIGLFDGSGSTTPSNYAYESSLSTPYNNYGSGHGVIVYNDNGSNGGMTTSLNGLNGFTITFNP